MGSKMFRNIVVSQTRKINFVAAIGGLLGPKNDPPPPKPVIAMTRFDCTYNYKIILAEFWFWVQNVGDYAGF